MHSRIELQADCREPWKATSHYRAGRNVTPDNTGLALKLVDAANTCLGACCVLGLALAAAQAGAAATVTVSAERGVDTIDVRASAVLKADGATAWRVLTDYERYVDFIPDLRLSHVVARRDSTVTVKQSGDAALWLLRVPVRVTFEINEMAPDRIQSRAVGGTLRALTSCYALTPVPAGIRLDYVGHVTPGFALFGQVELAAVEQNVARQFQALADEIERQGAGARPHSTPMTDIRSSADSSSSAAISSALVTTHVAQH
jgi:hypothetical protein